MGVLCIETLLARPRDEVFPFFADAMNLEAITPPWLRFRVLTPPPIEMRVGALIDYRLSIHGFPVRWQTEIAEWNPPFSFVDRQRRGPYRRWVHTHTFESRGERTFMVDRVDYAVFGGRLVEWMFVLRDVDRIFSYRRERLAEIFAPR